MTGSSSADGFTSLTGKTGQSEIGCLRRGASSSYLYGINECGLQLLSHENLIQCSYGLGTNNLPTNPFEGWSLANHRFAPSMSTWTQTTVTSYSRGLVIGLSYWLYIWSYCCSKIPDNMRGGAYFVSSSYVQSIMRGGKATAHHVLSQEAARD